MVKRRKPNQTNQSNDKAEQANTNRSQNEDVEEAQAGLTQPSRQPRTRKPTQAALEGPLRRSIRISRNKPSAFDSFSYDIQRLMIGNFLKKLDMDKQIQLRGVSQLWAGEVAHNCKLVKALVLILTEPAVIDPNQGEMLFERTKSVLFNWDAKDHGKTITPSQVKVLSIGVTHWNSATIESIGQLFRHIKHLSIYDDTTGAPPDSDKYRALWSMLPNVEALILGIKSPITREDFLERLFGLIEQHLAPLEALALRLGTNIVFPRLPPENIARTTQFMRNFTLTCSVTNLNEIIQMVGRDLHIRFPIKTPPIRELEMDATKIEEEQVEPMFVRNPALGQVTWLRLTKVANLKAVIALLGQNRALETLHLEQRCKAICFGNELFTAVSKLANLRRLFLFRFDIFDFGTIFKIHQATQIRELLINKYGQFEHILAEWRKKNDALLDQNGAPRSVDTLYPALGETQEAIFRPFVANVARLFPNLNVFVLVTNMTFLDHSAYRQWCREEFKYLKIYGISVEQFRMYRD